jgi:hypothetical protein
MPTEKILTACSTQQLDSKYQVVDITGVIYYTVASFNLVCEFTDDGKVICRNLGIKKEVYHK